MAPNDLIFSDQKKIIQYDDRVMDVYMRYTYAREAYYRPLKRCIENWRYYVALDAEHGNGQWRVEALKQMIAQGRQILTYNICEPIVDRIAGGMMALPIDPDFMPINSEITSLTEIIKKAMYSDKEIMDWSGVALQMAKGGLIFDSVMKMVVSDKYDALGNIGFEYCHPGSVTPDQMWRTWRSGDAKVCWHEQFFQPDYMKELWPEAEEILAPWLNTIASTGHQYGSPLGPTAFGNITENSWGTALKVISQYEMKSNHYKQEYVMTPAGDTPIPHHLKDTADKIQWLNANVPEWIPDQVFEKTEKEQVCIVTRICPTISFQQSIECRKPEIQIGRLPYFWWSASRDNGEPHSVIDSVKDTQDNVNYWESLITNKIQIEGGGGSQFADRAGFKDDAEYERYKRLRNNPTETFETKWGYMNGGKVPVAATVTSQFPREAYEHLNHLIGTMLPHISKVTPVSKGIQEGSGQSGYLYKLMTIQSEQQLYTIHYGWRVFWNEVYEGYLIQASQTYSNQLLPRKFALNKGKETVTLNERVQMEDGSIGVKNDASKLRYIRHKVIISEKQSSPSQRIEDLKVMGDYIPTIPGEMQVTRMYLTIKSSELIDVLDEDDKGILKKIGEEELGTAMAMLREKKLQSELNVILLENKKAEAMAAIQVKQMQAQQIPAGQGSQVQGDAAPIQANQQPQVEGEATFNNEPQAQEVTGV